MYINEEIDRLRLNVDIEDDQLKFQYFVFNQSESTQLLWRQDTKIFLARWMLIGQFKFQARQPYARNAWLE